MPDDQTVLLPERPADAWWRCRGIFTPPYLRQHLLDESGEAPSEAEVQVLHAQLRDLWRRLAPALSRSNEAFTCDDFIKPVLASLGWHVLPQQDLPRTGYTGPKTPDYCLFQDDDARLRAAAAPGTLDAFRTSLTVLEAKRWEHPLDRVSTQETVGLFPSDQIAEYLRFAKDPVTGDRFFDWALLTNGSEWRLYCEQAPDRAYFAFHLVHRGEFCSLEDFRLFVSLFRPGSFAPDRDGRCRLDDIRQNALSGQVELEQKLQRRIFGVLEDLAGGFFFHGDNGLTEADLGSVYQNSLILLYRLLFVLYAESRDLLPAKRQSGAGSRRAYRETYSLDRFVPRLRDRGQFPEEAVPDLYQDLLRLFDLINGTRASTNRELGVTRYDGGLFDPQSAPRLSEWVIGNKALGDVLRQLMFAQPTARSRRQQQVLFTEETIDYSTLEVRQLGDIYEGLLGAHLEVREGRLHLANSRGQNQREGIFYTPDWVVQFLVRNALQPLLDEIEAAPDVQAARRGNRRDNSYADAVLRLNLVDPAMGSGHFLVRATEWLGDEIVTHPTTQRMTDMVVTNGDRRRTIEDIRADGLIPVHQGHSQEEAEIAYWRRRVVEACIYGVDTNTLAVELAKLSLWLTCISINEPLNFLDHHLRPGNSLLFVNPDELHEAPRPSDDPAGQVSLHVAPQLADALRAVMDENARIEGEASTDLGVVKRKKRDWDQARKGLQPFLEVASLWMACQDGVSLAPHEYRLLALAIADKAQLSREERRRARTLRADLEDAVQQKRQALSPFHWQLEFPDVFFHSDGTPMSEAEAGFDAVLGNPPYISTHTSSEELWRNALSRRAGYLDDLYVHFTDLGFRLLRAGGTFGFIVSDTFFTLASKLRMREWLQRYSVLALGQCDPFDATVDAAMFVARKLPATEDHDLLFIQARYGSPESKPDSELPKVAVGEVLPPHTDRGIQHDTQGCLRLHRAPLALYREALKRVFFEPRHCVVELYRRFNEPTADLVDEWWDRISTSERVSQNLPSIRAYQAQLQPGQIALVGLIAEGGQGLRTANNGRFAGYLAGTPQAEAIAVKREERTRLWLADQRIGPQFLRLLRENGGDARRPTASVPAWEACVEPLKEQFTQRELGFGRTDLYRVVPPDLVATEEDFRFTWQRRKPELLRLWQTSSDLVEFWQQTEWATDDPDWLPAVRAATDITDEEFCRVCQLLLAWRDAENARRARSRPRRRSISITDLGLRSSESYLDPADVPRVATIYNGLFGRRQWVRFRKGDPEGNRWADNDPLYIDWSAGNVAWLFDNSGRSETRMPVIRNAHLYFTEGLTYTLLGNHVALKAKLQPMCVFDASASRLTPALPQVPTPAMLAVLNSDVFSFFLRKFIKNTAAFEITDLRMMPVVIPTPEQSARLSRLAEAAIQAKRLTFANQPPTQELVEVTRNLAAQLAAAPPYLRPGAQAQLLDTPDACLSIIERAVNWEAEKLYGVEGLGPFDEF